MELLWKQQTAACGERAKPGVMLGDLGNIETFGGQRDAKPQRKLPLHYGQQSSLVTLHCSVLSVFGICCMEYAEYTDILPTKPTFHRPLLNSANTQKMHHTLPTNSKLQTHQHSYVGSCKPKAYFNPFRSQSCRVVLYAGFVCAITLHHPLPTSTAQQ